MTTRKKGDKWISYRGVSMLTELSETTIRRLVAADDFPIPVRVGKSIRFVKREVMNWMEQMENRRQSA